jgi:hypothetical protein
VPVLNHSGSKELMRMLELMWQELLERRRICVMADLDLKIKSDRGVAPI